MVVWLPALFCFGWMVSNLPSTAPMWSTGAAAFPKGTNLGWLPLRQGYRHLRILSDYYRLIFTNPCSWSSLDSLCTCQQKNTLFHWIIFCLPVSQPYLVPGPPVLINGPPIVVYESSQILVRLCAFAIVFSASLAMSAVLRSILDLVVVVHPRTVLEYVSIIRMTHLITVSAKLAECAGVAISLFVWFSIWSAAWYFIGPFKPVGVELWTKLPKPSICERPLGLSTFLTVTESIGLSVFPKFHPNVNSRRQCQHR